MQKILIYILSIFAIQLVDLLFNHTDIGGEVNTNYLKGFLLLTIIITWLLGIYKYSKNILPYSVTKHIWAIVYLAGVLSNIIIFGMSSRYLGFTRGGGFEIFGIILIVVISLLEMGLIKNEKVKEINIKHNYFMEYYAIMGYAFILNIFKGEYTNNPNLSAAILVTLFFLIPFYKYFLAIKFVQAKTLKEKLDFWGGFILIIISAVAVLRSGNVFVFFNKTYFLFNKF